MTERIHITWLYPDVLNLHGDRGNIMAWQRIATGLGLEAEIKRVDDLAEKLDLSSTDIVFLCPGELKNMPKVIAALRESRAQLDEFVERKGYLFAIGTSGAVLAQQTSRCDGSHFSGLGLLPMSCTERRSVYGDDLWFSIGDGREIIGNQIQVLDTVLLEGAEAFGRVIYGHGNNKGADEGCRAANTIFTNSLGPLLVKNPRFAAQIIMSIAQSKSVQSGNYPGGLDTEYEDKSFELIKSFIQKKMA